MHYRNFDNKIIYIINQFSQKEEKQRSIHKRNRICIMIYTRETIKDLANKNNKY